MTSMPASGRHPRNLLSGRTHQVLAGAAGDVVPVGLLTVFGAVLRFLRLGDQGLWYDESYTMMLVRHSPGQMLGLIPRTESTPPLYYCLAWVWTRVFGRTAFGLRSLSALAGTALVPLAYGSAKEILCSRRAGIICAALTAFNPLLWWYSQEARAYELLATLCALSLWAFVRALRGGGARAVAVWTVASMLALGTHYFAAMLVIPEAAWLLIAHRRRVAVWVGSAFVVASGLALVPLVRSQSARNHDAWIARAPMSLRLGQIVPQFLIGTGAPERDVLKFVAFACTAAAFALLATASPVERRGVRLAGGLTLAGAAIVAISIPLGFDEVLTRNLIELWLPLAICAAGGLAVVRHPRIGAAATSGLCTVGLIAIVGVLSDPTLQRPAWPALVHALGARPPAAEARLIVVQRERGKMPLSVYMPGIHWLNTPARLSELDVVAMRPLHGNGRFCWWGSECNLVPSPLQARYRVRGFRPVKRFRVAQFVLELRASRPTLVTRGELARALTVTRLTRDGLLLQS